MATLRAPRILYDRSFRSREAAEDRIADLFAIGEISECDKPLVVRYGTGLRGRGDERNFWRITLLDGEG